MADKKVSREFDPALGELVEVVEEVRAPQRSWTRGGEAGKHDFEFSFDGATIYCRYVRDWDEIESRQESLLAMAGEIQKASLAMTEMQEKDVSLEETRAAQQSLMERVDAVNARTGEFALDVVTRCVVGWKGAPKPYSEENKRNLPFDILNDWLRLIVENSRLSKAEARFLATS